MGKEVNEMDTIRSKYGMGMLLLICRFWNEKRKENGTI